MLLAVSRLSRLSHVWDRLDRWDRLCCFFRYGDVVRLRLFESALDSTLCHIEEFRYLANSFAITLHLEDSDYLLVVIRSFAVLEMVILFGIALKFELEETAGLDQIVGYDVLNIILLLASADFDLL